MLSLYCRSACSCSADASNTRRKARTSASCPTNENDHATKSGFAAGAEKRGKRQRAALRPRVPDAVKASCQRIAAEMRAQHAAVQRTELVGHAAAHARRCEQQQQDGRFEQLHDADRGVAAAGDCADVGRRRARRRRSARRRRWMRRAAVGLCVGRDSRLRARATARRAVIKQRRGDTRPEARTGRRSRRHQRIGARAASHAPSPPGARDAAPPSPRRSPCSISMAPAARASAAGALRCRPEGRAESRSIKTRC
jgi:hypothetical protein